MYYVIQENLFREFHYNTLIEYLERYNLGHETVPFRPFTDELEVKTDRKDVFFFGSVNGAQIAAKKGWNPGCLYNDSHDFEVYSVPWREHMLNRDGTVIQFGDPIPDHLGFTFFCRPTKDTKIFSGGTFTRDSYNEWVEDSKRENQLEKGTFEYIRSLTPLLVAPLKDGIQQEIRCWVVDGEVVTASQYKIGRRVVYQNHDNNEEAMIFAKSLVKKYQPAKAFVLDICLYQDEYYVVEVNCINCSGFYDGNMSKLIQALEKTFG